MKLFAFLGSFEIVVNGNLVFSKLERGGFPKLKDVSPFKSGITTVVLTGVIYCTCRFLLL